VDGRDKPCHDGRAAAGVPKLGDTFQVRELGTRLLASPRNYLLKQTLKDGTIVTLRAVRRDDGPKIRQAFHTLAPETIHTRFFGAKTNVSDSELRRITDVDFERDAALLVAIGEGDQQIVIGGASYFALDAFDPPRSAELAFTVEEDYRGRGIASLLMRHIVRIARANGLLALEADVFARNMPMLAVFRRSGLPLILRHDADVVHATLALA